MAKDAATCPFKISVSSHGAECASLGDGPVSAHDPDGVAARKDARRLSLETGSAHGDGNAARKGLAGHFRRSVAGAELVLALETGIGRVNQSLPAGDAQLA